MRPLSRLTEADRERILAVKGELLKLLAASDLHDREEDEIDRVARADGWQPPAEIPPAVVAEIKRIEAQALALGWNRNRLWNFAFWPHRRDESRGLASMMLPGDTIIEVHADHIVIAKDDRREVRQRFWRFQS